MKALHQSFNVGCFTIKFVHKNKISVFCTKNLSVNLLYFKIHLPKVDQMKAKTTTINLTINKAVVCLAININRHTIKETVNGHTQ